MDKSILKLDWCSYAAAKYAVEHWHYSRRMPAGKLVKIGVWERDQFVGCILFGMGGGQSTNGKSYGFRRAFDIAELVRVALRKHESHVSRMLAIAIKMIRTRCPGLKMLTSFADSGQGHLGGIYKAGGWLYLGAKTYSDAYVVFGETVHKRSTHARGWKQSLSWIREHVDPNATSVPERAKHHYVFPLCDAAMLAVKNKVKPYPT